MILAWEMQKEGAPRHTGTQGYAVDLDLGKAFLGNQCCGCVQKPLSCFLAFSWHELRVRDP
jgi:hypothetical protein